MPNRNQPLTNPTRRSVLAAIPVATGTFTMSAAANNGSANTNNETTTQGNTTDNEPDTDPDTPNQVRLTHLSPDSGAVDLYADGRKTFTTAPLKQSEYKYYEPGATGTATVTQKGGSRDNPLLSRDVSLNGGPISLTLIGEVCKQSDRPLQLIKVQDNYSKLVSDHARLKAVHASPDAPALDYRTDDGDTLVSGLEFGEYGYSIITAGETIIAVHKAGESEPLARFNIEPNANSVYSAFSVGYLNPEAAPEAAAGFNFALGVVEDTSPTDE